jgi:hypothetical protein
MLVFLAGHTAWTQPFAKPNHLMGFPFVSVVFLLHYRSDSTWLDHEEWLQCMRPR